MDSYPPTAGSLAFGEVLLSHDPESALLRPCRLPCPASNYISCRKKIKNYSIIIRKRRNIKYNTYNIHIVMNKY